LTVRFIAIALAIAQLGAAADASNWISEAGGVVIRDHEGQIVAVNLRAGWLSDSDISSLATLPSLSRLDLSLTRISDHGLRELKNAPGIADLNLCYAELITDEGLLAVRTWHHLRRLNLHGTKITDMTLQHLSGMNTLESLDIGFVQVTDVGLDQLTNLSNLRELMLGGNKLSDVGLQSLRQLTGLTYLDLGGAQRTDSGLWSVSITDSGMEAIASLRNLLHLRLNGTSVSGRSLEKLKELRFLERLDLQDCKHVGDDAIPTLSSLPSLRVIDLTGTHVTTDGLTALRRARPECRILTSGLSVKPPADESPRR
jgi:Leucine-rich repeat (LRR) protein